MKYALIAVAALCLGGCTKVAKYHPSPETKSPPRAVKLADEFDSGTFKFCDKGRAVYVTDSVQSVAMAVVENAPECAGT